MLLLPTLTVAGPIVFSGAGSNTAALTPIVEAFKTFLGTPENRSQITWDGVPDKFADLSTPGGLPGNFFNDFPGGVPRGIEYSNADDGGTGFLVSAKAEDPIVPILFANINPGYPSLFQAFSPQRIFTGLGSTVLQLHFFVPGTKTPASTTVFGAVFVNVKLPFFTQVQYYSCSKPETLLYKGYVPNVPNSAKTLSFLGVGFDGATEKVCSIAISVGTVPLSGSPLGTEGTSRFINVVTMDDFLFRNPQALP